MEQQQSKRDRARECLKTETLHTAEQNKAKEKELERYSHDTSLSLWNSSDDHFAIFTATGYISSSALSTYTLHVVTTDIYLHISGYFLREAYSAHAYS